MDEPSFVATISRKPGRPIKDERKARLHLVGVDHEMAALIRRVGRCTLRVRTEREPFEALVRAIAGQQLHARAAEAMLGRMLAHFPDGFPSPEALGALDDAAFRACGFSGSKTVAIRGVCAAAATGIVPTRRQAQRLSDSELIARLVPLRGIGAWTVEMLLIFTLGRPDIMPIDDYGVREGYRRIKGLEAQPKPKALLAATESWRPFRSVGAWYLWRAADEAKPAGRSPTASA
ncbi:DNA-3-methyladenine glycosylase family protein [Endosaccharibacter trunci]